MDILFEDGECKQTKISHHFQALLFSNLHGVLYLTNNTLWVNLATAIRSMCSYS